jgi:hypothetical protein
MWSGVFPFFTMHGRACAAFIFMTEVATNSLSTPFSPPSTHKGNMMALICDFLSFVMKPINLSIQLF